MCKQLKMLEGSIERERSLHLEKNCHSNYGIQHITSIKKLHE